MALKHTSKFEERSIPKTIYHKINEKILAGYDQLSKDFVTYIYAASIKSKTSYKSIHSDEIKKGFKGENYGDSMKLLIEQGIIERDYYIKKEKAYAYRLTTKIYDQLINLQFDESQLISTQTLEPIKKKKKKTQFYKKKNNNYYSDIIKDGIISCANTKVNFEEVQATEQRLLRKYRRSNDDLEKQEIKKLLDNFTNLRQYFSQQKGDFTTGEFLEAYKVGKTGRVFGFLQRLPRPIKEVIFTGFKNYDLSNSQVRIFYQLCCDHGIEAPNFEEYLRKPPKGQSSIREEIASRLKISLPDWKELFFMWLFKRKGNPKNYKSSLMRKMREIVPWSRSRCWEDLADERHQVADQIIDELKPYSEEIDRWTEFLQVNFKEFGALNSQRKFMVLNACQMPFYPIINKENGKEQISYRQAKLMTAHLIQGIESHFIFVMSKLAKEAGLEPINNEFDGLVVKKTIPPSLIGRAKMITGYQYMDLVPKDFCNKEEFLLLAA